MITFLTNNGYYKYSNNKKLQNLPFKGSDNQDAGMNYARNTYNRLKNIILASVPQQEYMDRKKYIVDCISGKEELNKEKFFENPNDRKKNLIILNDILEENIDAYMAAAKKKDNTLLDDNSKLNINIRNCYNFWLQKITDEDKEKYLHIYGDENCRKLFDMTEEEWIYASRHYIIRNAGSMKQLKYYYQKGIL